MSPKTLLILAIVTVLLAAGASTLGSERASESAWRKADERLFPGLDEKAERVTSLLIEGSEGITTVSKTGETWTVVERGGYPGRGDEVNRVLNGMALAERVEPKTAKAENYERLGLEDLLAEGSVTFTGLPEDGSTLTLSDGLTDPVTFEFLRAGEPQPGNQRVDIAAAASESDVARSLHAAVEATAGLGIDTEVTGGLVELTGTKPGHAGRVPIEQTGELNAEVQGMTIASQRTRVTAKDASGKVVADLFVGRRRPHGAGENWYVRTPDDETVWAVEGKLRVPSRTSEWLDTELMTVARDRIVQVFVEHADGERIEFSTEGALASNFKLVNVPEGREAKSASPGAAFAGSLDRLRFQDVQSGSTAELDEPPTTVTTFWTKDGLKMTCELWESEADLLCRFTPSVDEERAPTAEMGPAPDEPAAGPTREELEQEVADLKALTAGWIYTLPSWKKTSFTTTLESLLKELPEEEEVEEADPGDGAVPPPVVVPDTGDDEKGDGGEETGGSGDG